jgi:hypothetical protein
MRLKLTRSILDATLLLLLPGWPGQLAARGTALELAGVTVTPHVQSGRMRYRRPPDPGLGARVELFLRNSTTHPMQMGAALPVRFGGRTAGQLVAEGAWAWHDTPSAWPSNDLVLAPGALTVWSFNGTSNQWGAGATSEIAVDWPGDAPQRMALILDAPRVWLSSVTFLSSDASVFPDTMVVHVANESAGPVEVRSVRLWLPERNATWRELRAQPAFSQLERFPAAGPIGAGDRGAVRVEAGRLPLTYAAIEVRAAEVGGPEFPVWAHLRIKREVFDISGGWVASGVGGSNTLCSEAYLRTLRRMHVNAGMHEDVPGYTDAPALFDRYPLKYMNRCQPFDRFDTDAVLPRIHAVEFLGEPQYGGGRPVPPMDVWRAFAPYQATRLPTSVTHSEERVWRHYAGLSDYPHYDAYRVSAPAPDAWSRYERWGGATIRWGATLETIGDMTRSLRELNRPRPIAYWSQGAHHGWDRYGGRGRTSPTPDELRLQAYHALSSRITSLYWFNLSVRSLVKFRDLIEPITLLGREMRLLEPFLLEGDAFGYTRLARPDGAPDWDIASVCGPRAALLFALDLDYSPDPQERVFRFGPPRPARWRFPLPGYLRKVSQLFRLDAAGLGAVDWVREPDGVRVEDRASRVAVYVAAADPALRARIEARRQELLQLEASMNFDPARNDADFAELVKLAAGK